MSGPASAAWSSLPKGAQAMRDQALRAQSRRNAIGAAIVFSFVGSVFAYSIFAVGGDDNQITDRDVAEFKAQRELQKKQERVR